MTTKQVIGWFLAVVILAGGFILLGEQEEVIVIGVSAPLSGDLSIIGQPLQQAAQLALEDAVERYPSQHEFKLVFEDDQFKPAEAVTTINKLISIDRADVIVTAGSPTGMAVAPIAQQQGVPHFAIASADVAAAGDMNFNHWTPPAKQAELLVSELERTGVQTLSMITLDHEGGVAVRDAVVTELEGSSIRILREENFVPGTTDFRTIWQKIAQEEPDMVFFVAQTPELERLLRQQAELGVDIPVVTIESPLYTSEPQLYDGNWFVDAASHSEEFAQAFEQRTGQEPFVFSGSAYDIITVIVETYAESEEKLTAEEFVQAMHADPSGVGVMGEYVIDESGTFLTEATIKDMVDGEVVAR